MFRKSTAWTVLVYGIVLLFLGIYGYTQAHSKASLISGGTSGLLTILSSLLIFGRKKVGFYLAAVLAALLSGMFLYRFAITHKELPAVMSAVSALQFAFLLIKK